MPSKVTGSRRSAAAIACVAIATLAGCAMHGAPAPARMAFAQSAPQSFLVDSGAKTVPFFKRSFTYGGKTYPLKIVGTDPAKGGVTTTVPDQVIPIKLTFSDGTILDGTDEVSTLTASPIFVPAQFPSGNTQYGDALMREEFWVYAQNENYHVLVGSPNVLPTVALTVTPDHGSFTQGEGRVTYQWFVQTIEPQLLQQLNIDPTTLTIFLTKNTRVLEPNGFCCFNGYHSAFNITLPSGPATFTTAWASVSTASVTHMGHEVAEWMNDPFYTNAVPPWVKPMHTTCGGTKLEVGDPLASTLFTVNGYQVEDMTFYSWFARDMPSIGINGQYDMLAVLSGPAANCH